MLLVALAFSVLVCLSLIFFNIDMLTSDEVRRRLGSQAVSYQLQVRFCQLVGQPSCSFYSSLLLLSGTISSLFSLAFTHYQPWHSLILHSLVFPFTRQLRRSTLPLLSFPPFSPADNDAATNEPRTPSQRTTSNKHSFNNAFITTSHYNI